MPAAATVCDAYKRASWATLGRDQGIFQYIAWATSRGDLLYRDIRDVNGPLVALVHSVLLRFGAGEEHRFRVLDLAITALVASFAGCALVTLDAQERSAPASFLRMLSLSGAAWAVLSAAYLVYGYWDTAQRESFFGWFLLLSVGTQLIGQRCFQEPTAKYPRLGTALLVLSGACSFISCFGKPPFFLFTLGQVASLLFDRLCIGRLRRLGIVTAGAALGALPPIVFLILRGDLAGWLRISLVDVPSMYRFIWPRSASEIFRMPGYGAAMVLALVLAGTIVLLVRLKWMPRRGLVLTVMPLAGLATVAIQAKGFPYHFHPVTAGNALALVAVAHAVWNRAERSLSPLAVIGAGVVAMALGLRAAHMADDAPFPPAPSARDRPFLASAEYLDPYIRVDFFPKSLRDAAEYVANHTASSERVQTYGMDPYLLFLARRQSATPYIYAYDLDVDAALAGGAEEGARPTEDQKRVIVEIRNAHESDLLARLVARPPAAFVFHDHSPLMQFESAVEDFAQHCPTTFAWVSSRYTEAAEFHGLHVWLRVPRDDTPVQK